MPLAFVAAFLGLVFLAGCAATPPKLEDNLTVRVTVPQDASVSLVDARPESAKVARSSQENAELGVWMADQAFEPPLPAIIGAQLGAELKGIEIKSAKLVRADTGKSKGDGSARYNTSYYRGTPYIPPGTHPGAAALGIVLGEGLVFLAANAKTLSKPAEAADEFWTVYLTVEIDGAVFYGGHRVPIQAGDNAPNALSQAITGAVQSIASQHRVRFPELHTK